MARTRPLPDPAIEVALLTSPTDTDICVRYLLEDIEPLVFPVGTQAPYGLTDKVWADLLISEPALLNASMFMKLRFFSEDPTTSITQRATVHICRAIATINKRLSAPRTCFSDGMLAAVFMLGTGERLANNQAAWKVHAEGLTQMIKLRLAHGSGFIPQWFSDLILYDSISESISSSQTHQTKHINALRANNSHIMAIVSSISRRINQLREMLDQYYRNPSYPTMLENQIEAHTAELHIDLGPLRDHETTYIGALGRSLELFLYLSWPPTPHADLEDFAEGLKNNLGSPYARSCSSFHVKIWQFLVGAVAIEHHTDTREFFVRELKRMFRALRIHNWLGVNMILERTFLPDSQLLRRFKCVGDELGLD